MSHFAASASSRYIFIGATTNLARSCQVRVQFMQLPRFINVVQSKGHLFPRSSHYTTSPHGVRKVEDCDAEQLYRYTSGRWLWNEKDQFARRYVKFDLTGLLEVSAKAVGARRCVQIEKLPEGNFNKVFLLTMDNGKYLIAKIPNPNAGRPHYTTASEVATMDYVRDVLMVPAPRVYGWSSSTDNPVGAEYILMEQCQGVELDKVWDTMSWDDRFEIVSTLAGYEKAFVSAKMPMIGSLYYAKDLFSPTPDQFLELEKSANNGKAFAVGPTTHRTFYDKQRESVEVHRGPWPSVEEYVESRAARELACISKFSTYPGQQGLFGGPGQYCPSKELKIKVLQDYLKVASKVLPNDPALSKPTLWHGDLHAENIFVDPSDPTKISNIIDWQAISISPLFLQARHPSLIEFEGPVPGGLGPIELPDDFDQMSQDAQLQAKSLRAAQSLWKIYEILMLQQRPDIAHALQFRDTLSFRMTGLAGSIFSDGEPILQGMLIQLQDKWATRVKPPTPCPLAFSPEERAEQQRLTESWSKSVELMAEVLTEISVYQGWDGWVNHSNYDMYKERLAECRKKFLDRHAKNEDEKRQWEQVWPFQDSDQVQDA